MRNSKIFRKITLSYILILIIPMVSISIFVYSKYVNTFTDEIMNSVTLMLEQVRDVMDVHLRDLNNLSIQISLDQQILPLLISDDIHTVKLYPNVYDTIKELEKYKNTSSIIEDIFLIFPDENMVISNRTKMSYDILFEQYFLLSESSKFEINSLIYRNDKLTILPAQPVKTYDNMKNLMIYLQPLPIGTSYYKYNATLMITLNRNYIEKIINRTLNQYDGAVYIIDGDENIILNWTNSAQLYSYLLSEIPEYILNGENITEQPSHSRKNDDIIISSVKSSVTSWKYICVIDSDRILDKVDYIKLKYMEVILICLIVGLLTTYGFSRRNYRSVRNVMELLKSNGNGINLRKHDQIYDEWDFINDTIIEFVQHNRLLQVQLSEYAPIIKNSLILSLLNGRDLNTDAMSSMTEFTGIDITRHNSFVVAVIYIGEYDLLFRKLSNVNEEMFKITILTTFEDRLSSLGTVYTAEIERGSVGIIISMEEYNKDIKDISNNLVELKKHIEKQFKLNIYIGVGNIYRNVKEISISYLEANKALEYVVMKGDKGVVTYEEIYNIKQSVIQYYYSFEHEKEVVQYLRLGQFENIEKVINEIIEQVRHSYLSLELMKCICLDIVNTSIKVLDELNITEVDVNSYLRNIFLATTLDAIYDEIIRFYGTLCNIVLRARWWQDDELRDSMVDYINSNYQDKNMSLEALADHFNLSRSYTSKFFKDQLCCNFLDYLHSLRLDEAKRLLIETDRTILEIGDAVGYNSQTNFIRVFKRYEGITPTEYRKVTEKLPLKHNL